MDFIIENLKQSVSTVARAIGYLIIDSNGNEYNMVRKLSVDHYPRFHVYARQQGDNYSFSLHLDQKQPSYQSRGVHDHNGEYFGPVVENEVDRIRGYLDKLND